MDGLADPWVCTDLCSGWKSFPIDKATIRAIYGLCFFFHLAILSKSQDLHCNVISDALSADPLHLFLSCCIQLVQSFFPWCCVQPFPVSSRMALFGAGASTLCSCGAGDGFLAPCQATRHDNTSSGSAGQLDGLQKLIDFDSLFSFGVGHTTSWYKLYFGGATDHQGKKSDKVKKIAPQQPSASKMAGPIDSLGLQTEPDKTIPSNLGSSPSFFSAPAIAPMTIKSPVSPSTLSPSAAVLNPFSTNQFTRTGLDMVQKIERLQQLYPATLVSSLPWSYKQDSYDVEEYRAEAALLRAHAGNAWHPPVKQPGLRLLYEALWWLQGEGPADGAGALQTLKIWATAAWAWQPGR